MKKSRSAIVILSPEAHVLRTLRVKHRMSMRQAGAKLGFSDSYISQIENGRENPPYGEKLQRFLNLYGGIGEKHFRQLCKDFKEEQTDELAIRELLPKLSSAKLKLLRSITEQMARQR